MICTSCHQEKPEDAFYWRKEQNRPTRRCRECHSTAMRKYRSKPVTKVKLKAEYRRRHLRKTFDMSEEEYASMASAQNNLCRICKSPERSARRLAIDHCHTSGKIRGLLCNPCNRGIGLLKDSPEIIRAAAVYLDLHS